MDGRIMPRVGLFIANLGGGGVQNVIINLAGGLIKNGVEVDLVVGWAHGINKQKIPERLNLIDLNQKRIIFCLIGLLRYLFTFHPEVLLTAQTHVNIVGVIARMIFRKRIRLVVCEHNDMQAVIKTYPKERYRPLLAHCFYPFADEIVAVSKGVANSLSVLAGIPLERIRVLYNPLVSDEMLLKSMDSVSHPWFYSGGPQVALAVGRLEEQKDFATLLQALAVINQKRLLKLVILGEGSQYKRLMSLANELGLNEKVDFPGFVDNPYAYMSKSSIFVLSSKFEGFPGVLVEAMACGIPVVSTNCPSGPGEILEDGKFGRLVPVGDVETLAKAIEESLDDPFPLEESRKRSLVFNINNTTLAYLNLLFPNCEKSR